jgi:hypothetical protein
MSAALILINSIQGYKAPLLYVYFVQITIIIYALVFVLVYVLYILGISFEQAVGYLHNADSKLGIVAISLPILFSSKCRIHYPASKMLFIRERFKFARFVR